MSKKSSTKSRGGKSIAPDPLKKTRAKAPGAEGLKASSSGVQRRGDAPPESVEPRRALLDVKPAPKNEPIKDSEGPFKAGMPVFDFEAREPVPLEEPPASSKSGEQIARTPEALKKRAEFVKRLKGLSGAG